jgi:hypothetical protein
LLHGGIGSSIDRSEEYHTWKIPSVWFSFNVTFINISVISWRSVLMVEDIEVPAENHRPVASHWQTCIEYTSPWTGFKLTTLVVIGTNVHVVVNPTTIRSRPGRHLRPSVIITNVPICHNINDSFTECDINKTFLLHMTCFWNNLHQVRSKHHNTKLRT